MLSVASSLLVESDKLGGKVLENWEEERRIRKRVIEIREHRIGAGGGTAGLGVPAGVARHKSQKSGVMSGISSPLLGGAAQMSTPQVPQQEEDTIDPREVDALLAEMSMMSGRWQLLRRFLYGRLKVGCALVSTLARR